MIKGNKFRIYPNKEQQQLIEQTFGCCRLVYNKALAYRKEAYDERQEKIGYKQTSAMLTDLKNQEEFSFLRDVDSIALQQALRDLDMSYSRFFKKIAKYPRFRKKSDNHQSYRTLSHISIVGNFIKLPKLGYVKIRQSMEIGKIRNATIERTPSGKYFVVLCTDFTPKKIENQGKTITITFGANNFYTDDRGNTVYDPPGLDDIYKKMQKEQQRLSRKQSGSNNREKQRIKLGRVHERLNNKRNDFLQKLSTELIRENQTIIIDDSKIKEEGVNYTQSKSPDSISYCKFIEMLKYKAEWYGNEIVILGEET